MGIIASGGEELAAGVLAVAVVMAEEKEKWSATSSGSVAERGRGWRGCLVRSRWPCGERPIWSGMIAASRPGFGWLSSWTGPSGWLLRLLLMTRELELEPFYPYGISAQARHWYDRHHEVRVRKSGAGKSWGVWLVELSSCGRPATAGGSWSISSLGLSGGSSTDRGR